MDSTCYAHALLLQILLSYLLFFFYKNASSKTSFSQLVTGLCVIQFCLQSYKWQSNQTVHALSCTMHYNMYKSDSTCTRPAVTDFAELSVFFFHKNASSKTSFSQLVTGLCVIQFCLQSYKWQSNQTPSSWSSDFVNLLIWLQTELDSTIINSLFDVLHFVCVNLYLVQNIPEAKWCTAVAIKKCS